MKVNKTVMLALALILIGTIGYKLFISGKSNEIRYLTSKVERGTILSTIRATGRLKPTKEIDIYAETDGVVKKTYGEINDKVKKGGLLAIIDRSGSEAKLNQTVARLNKNKSDLELNKDTYNINKSLYEKRLISKEEFDKSLSAYSSSVAELEEAKAELEQAKLNFGKTEITSSLNGIILNKKIIEGQKLYPDNSEPIYTIAEDLTTLNLVSNISEAEIGKIAEGQEIYFTVDAYPGEKFYGAVTKILNSPKSENNVVTYDVLSSVNNEELFIKPGMTAEVEITISNKDNILKIPTAALRFIPPKDAVIAQTKKAKTVVWTLSGTRLEAIEVNTGISDDQYTEIEGENIQEGKELLVEYFYKNAKETSTGITLPQPKRF
ncbi:MAG: efflux RND transporter periplasmic adaptor subunit [Thermodesulfobacteriota bacterium]